MQYISVFVNDHVKMLNCVHEHNTHKQFTLTLLHTNEQTNKQTCVLRVGSLSKQFKMFNVFCVCNSLTNLHRF